MGVNFLIMWVVIEPIMREVITETRVSTLASWCCSDAEMLVSTLASWYCSDAEISPTSEVWTLPSDDLSLVIFRQLTEPPPKFSIFRGLLRRILKYFGLWLSSYFS